MVTVDADNILCYADFMNIQDQNRNIFLVLKISDKMYPLIDETTGKYPMITATNILFLVIENTFSETIG